MSHIQAFKPVVDGAMADVLARVRSRRVEADAQTLATVEIHYSAFRHLLELCSERELDATVPDAFDRLFQAALRSGHVQADFAVLGKVMAGPGVAA